MSITAHERSEIMTTTLGRLAGLTAAATLGILIQATGPAAAIPYPGPLHSQASTVHHLGACQLERVDHQLVRCDDLTGAGAPAPASIPVSGIRAA
jgi:hypothetical protein